MSPIVSPPKVGVPRNGREYTRLKLVVAVKDMSPTLFPPIFGGVWEQLERRCVVAQQGGETNLIVRGGAT